MGIAGERPRLSLVARGLLNGEAKLCVSSVSKPVDQSRAEVDIGTSLDIESGRRESFARVEVAVRTHHGVSIPTSEECLSFLDLADTARKKDLFTRAIIRRE